MKLSRTVNWQKESKKLMISDEQEWNDMIDSLDWDKYIPFEVAKQSKVLTHRTFWREGRWSYVWEGERPIVYLGKEIDDHEIWFWAPAEELADEQQEEEVSIKGFDALRALKEKMQETNGKKFAARFGAIRQEEENLWLVKELHAINQCVGPFIGNSSFVGNQYYDGGIYKADVSSAYPAEGIYKLPDWRTMQLFDYCIEPSEEWPIVFYFDTHHVAEYNVFDTRVDMYHPLYREYRNNRKAVYAPKRKREYKARFKHGFDSVECAACKYSDFNLEEFLYFYDRKKDDPMAKAIMNLSIGTFDFIECPNYEIKTCRIPYLGHLRAVICARHNHNMIKYYDEIEKKGYEVLQVQTDSIIWKGGLIDSATRDKQIGKLHLEIENGRAFIHGCGAYWVEDSERAIEKHQGMRNWKPVESLEAFQEFFENRPKIEGYFINEKTLKFELEVI